MKTNFGNVIFIYCSFSLAYPAMRMMMLNQDKDSDEKSIDYPDDKQVKPTELPSKKIKALKKNLRGPRKATLTEREETILKRIALRLAVDMKSKDKMPNEWKKE